MARAAGELSHCAEQNIVPCLRPQNDTVLTVMSEEPCMSKHRVPTKTIAGFLALAFLRETEPWPGTGSRLVPAQSARAGLRRTRPDDDYDGDKPKP